jgi:hypothetical protein
VTLQCTAGGALKDCTRLARLPAGQESLPSRSGFVIGSRSKLISQLDAALLWRPSAERGAELRALLIGLRAADQ